MMDIIKKYILPVIMVIGLIAVWLSGDFLKESSQTLSGIFEKRLPFKVNPMRYGGEILAVVDDDINDNLNYILPENEVFNNGQKLTDIVSYKVHSPSDDIEGNTLWNIDIYFHDMQFNVMNPNKFDLITGVIYIDINGYTLSVNNEPLDKSENIKFSKDFNWDYVVEFDYLHKNGILYSSSSKKTYPVYITVFEHDNKIRLGIPIVEKIKRKMDKKYMGKHIACVGFYSQFDDANLIPTENISPYYDFVSSSELITADTITLSPVILNNYTEKNKIENLDNILIRLNKVKEEEYDSKYLIINEEIKNAVKLYKDNNYDGAEKILVKHINKSSIANTYMGLITALKADDNSAGVNKQVELVHSAYDYFEKAEKLVKNDNDLYYLLINRIGVSVSVPDEIFGKQDQAEKDIERLLKLDLSAPEKAENILHLIKIYQQKNMDIKLRLILNEVMHDLN